MFGFAYVGNGLRKQGPTYAGPANFKYVRVHHIVASILQGYVMPMPTTLRILINLTRPRNRVFAYASLR